MSTYLQAIDKRLRGLEDAVVKLTEESKAKWEQIEKRWDGLESLVSVLLTITGGTLPCGIQIWTVF